MSCAVLVYTGGSLDDIKNPSVIMPAFQIVLFPWENLSLVT